jgi:hypothetical protein
VTTFSEVFVPPALPAPRGVFDVVTWLQNGTTPLRFLAGMSVRQSNIGLCDQLGVWGADWCAVPGEPVAPPPEPPFAWPSPMPEVPPVSAAAESGGESKLKVRPPAVLTEVAPITVYAYDSNQCGDLTAASRDEVRARAQQVMARCEQTAVERWLADRFLAEAVNAGTRTTVVEAVAILEAELARLGVTGYLHASPKFAAYLADGAGLSTGGTSPMGHRFVFGNGYADGLADRIVATTDLYGWRGPVEVRDAVTYERNDYIVVVERSLLIAYESAVAAVTVVAG